MHMLYQTFYDVIASFIDKIKQTARILIYFTLPILQIIRRLFICIPYPYAKNFSNRLI